MKIINVDRKNLEKIKNKIKKSYSDFDSGLVSAASKIVEDVKKNGNRALFNYTKKFDRFDVNSRNVAVSQTDIEKAVKSIPRQLLKDLRTAAKRIETYQKKKLPVSYSFKDQLGNELGWEVRAVEKAGLYVPGGKAAYPSTVLMTAIPAKVAGVRDISIVTPCPGGELNPTVLAAASICGINKIYKVGGAQAIAALAYGTRSIEKVDVIAGPGNIYVTIAKKLVFGAVDIDTLAGPSEVLIIADGSCQADWIAADLLAQAEHDEMAIPTLITTSRVFAAKVKKETGKLLATLPRKKIASEAIKRMGKIYTVKNLDMAADLSNTVAPEHLELFVKSPKTLLKKINNAGAVFLGDMSTESFGDYIAGPSHVLPTGGASRFASPLSVYDFIRMPSTIQISKKGFKALSQPVINMAESEGLGAHALSVKVRLDK